MIILVMGASHTGKTALAQKSLEKFGYDKFHPETTIKASIRMEDRYRKKFFC